MRTKARKISGSGRPGIDHSGGPTSPSVVGRVNADGRTSPINVGVKIDQARRDQFATYIPHLGHTLARKVQADGGYLAIAKSNIGDSIQTLGRVDHSAAGEKKVMGHLEYSA